MAFDRALAPLADAGNRPALTAAGDALAFAFVDVPVALAVFRRCVADDPTAAGGLLLTPSWYSCTAAASRLVN